jgi:hypothetical protein
MLNSPPCHNHYHSTTPITLPPHAPHSLQSTAQPHLLQPLPRPLAASANTTYTTYHTYHHCHRASHSLHTTQPHNHILYSNPQYTCPHHTTHTIPTCLHMSTHVCTCFFHGSGSTPRPHCFYASTRPHRHPQIPLHPPAYTPLDGATPGIHKHTPKNMTEITPRWAHPASPPYHQNTTMCVAIRRREPQISNAGQQKLRRQSQDD